MANQNGPAPIIIKRVKKGGHDGHHGGAWKVAYADFVTAMMAFFLLLWLLNATTDEQKRGISDYFSPASIARSNSGSGGVMGGTSLNPESAMRSDDAQPMGVTVPLNDAVSEAETDSEASNSDAERLSDEELRRELQEREAAQFAETERILRITIQQDPALQGLSDSIRIDQTPEGLRIQLIDQAGRSNFPRGSHQMFDHTRQLLGLVASSISTLPHDVAIKGHTDATPFVAKNGYTNWELSTDRANATRRALLVAGLSMDRISSVTGRADQDLLVPQDPFSANNRRIAIILLREAPVPLGANSGLKADGPGTR